MYNNLNIAIIDDHPLIISGLRELLLNNVAISSFVSFNNSNDLYVHLSENAITILIVDIRISNTEDGFNIANYIKKNHPEIKIIIYSGFINQSYIAEAIKIQVNAYVSKDSPIEEILTAIEEVSNDNNYYSNDVKQLIDFYDTQQISTVLYLSDREIEVLKLICKGLDYKQIADQLYISKHTVRSHRQNLMIKTKCHNIHDLYNFAKQNGFIDV